MHSKSRRLTSRVSSSNLTLITYFFIVNFFEVLRSDHKEITLKIEKNIEVLHSGHMGTMLPQKRTGIAIN
jgi:hypothetical protein